MEEERKMILKMVESGKISAEEGAKLLQALNQEEKKPESSTTNEENVTSATEKEKVKSITDHLSDLSTKVDWGEGNKRYNQWQKDKDKDKTEPGMKKFSDFIENTLQKIKELDLDFNFGSYIEVNHIFQHQNMFQSKIDVSLENGSLNIESWDEPHVRLETKAKVYKAKNPDEAREEFLKETDFEVAGEELHFHTKTKAIKVNGTLYLPKKDYASLQFYTFNGHFKGEKLKAQSLTAKVVNGSMIFNDVHAQAFKGETVSGPVTISGGTIDRCDVQTMHGTIELEALMKDVEAESLNGTISARLNIAEDTRANLAATTGSVFVTVPSTIRTDGILKTNIGNYNWTMPNVEVIEEKKDFVQKSITFVSNQSGSPRLRLEASTKTGSISLKNMEG
ncbi:DUF4097 family beta strand repeat-containing protein [Bacillus sp. FJAT-44742]|uniref:DUF4097 family beta strand repeat-containing protein n=1 Tax=Bacillus sp. FJAT-44742 TaxID=2014005 RepID=UPI000C23938A|nr:DUF4097 domain-containing protein [Bacillus sp. FJAT-44742]